MPMASVPRASKSGLPVQAATGGTPTSATRGRRSRRCPRAARRAARGCAMRRMNCHHDRSPSTCGSRPRRCASEKPSRRMAKTARRRRCGDSTSWGLRSFWMPSYNGEHATEGEEHEGDDERPEVALAPVAERVLGGRRLAARRSPKSRSPWLALSATEWIDSASIDAAPVSRNATNLPTATPRLAPSAAKIAFLLSPELTEAGAGGTPAPRPRR